VTPLEGHERAAYILEMFGQISDRYDRMNRFMALGQDRAWRRQAVSAATLPPGGLLLDVGSGTGDIALEAVRRNATLRVMAVDFSAQMMQVGRRRPGGQRRFCCHPGIQDTSPVGPDHGKHWSQECILSSIHVRDHGSPCGCAP
jgi:ubiquinone/menaquinone biosynthesis C-methylase UbiE